MKKLNRKGFTLVELLAVIVILAIVVGITLVTLLPTLENSRKKAFDTAVESIKTYITSQYEMSLLSDDLRGDSYNEDLITAAKACNATTPCTGTSGNLLTATGYNNNISEIKWYISGGRAVITCADASGDYVQSDFTACTAS